MNKKMSRAAVLCLVLGLCGVSLDPFQCAHAASGDGSLVGRLASSDKSSMAGAEVTAINPETGFSRTVKADAEGYYRFPYLPVGRYQVEATKDGTTIGTLTDVSVNLGIATTANFDLGGSTLAAVEVVGSRIVNAVDVKSVESATNVTREELERLPVERDLLSVAMLAPGLTKGDAAPGLGGVSFGGASVAENTVYINGLNVTDFYSRTGFSSVPYAFFKEFQVKTGGYSVEFGRTTGGVINAVTRSGTNKFEFGTEMLWEPDFLQSSKSDRPGVVGSFDEYDRRNITAYASGPILRDKLFFFALYELRNYKPIHTDDAGENYFDAKSDDAFWGAKVDWQISDKHLLELLAFSDKNEEAEDNYDFDLASGSRGSYLNTQFENTGGRNWALTYTGYLASNFSMKVLYGENEREFSRLGLNDIDCNRVRNGLSGTFSDVGCTSTPNITARLDNREAARMDFEWSLGDHQVRFGLDRETNTSEHNQFYPGPDRLLYEVNLVTSSTLPNGAPVPPGVTAYVRTRRNEVDGEFETLNSAYYVEDNWSVTPTLVLNAGVRLEAFNNKNSDGDSYIKMDNMVAPRFGFAWDMRGDSRTKLFGNAGRYFLPVANVINIKQAGGFLDERTFYVFNGFEPFEYNGAIKQRVMLGPQIGPVDTSQGDGTVGDLRGEVDGDMDPVYQDELILGFQSMLTQSWSWGVRGIMRSLHNAIDDMAITSTGIICDGEPVSAGFVMANPGEPVTIFTDTDCDGESDNFVTIDTATGGWAVFDDAGNYLGDRGYDKPTRTYRALEFVVDRAWDSKWSVNAAYTLSYNRGNTEGPVNSDTNFGDTGRTEAFDDPYVNLNGYGNLPNDRRHQFKLRGTYGFAQGWRVGATLSAQSGRPLNAFGVGNPFDDTNYHSFYICVDNCTSPNNSERVYELRGRGSVGRTPWTFNLGANVTWERSLGLADMLVKLSVYNLLNQERLIEVNEDLVSTDPLRTNPAYLQGTNYQSPRYGQLTLQLRF